MNYILITGGAGYVGSHTVHYLLSRDIPRERIIVFDDLKRGHQEFVPDGVKLVAGDLKNREQIGEVFQRYPIETVIHFAALAYVGESMLDPGSYFENNVSGGIHLLEAMHLGGCNTIIFSSSCATYGHAQTSVLNEKHPQCPINPYGESKLIFEKLLHWYDAIFQIRHVSLRYFNAAGADFAVGEWHDPETHLIPIAIEAIQGKRDYLQIFGENYPTPDGTCIRDYIHVTDLADAHYRAMEYLAQGGKSIGLNLGTGTGVSVKEVVRILEEVSARTVPIRTSPPRHGDPPVLVADARLANQVLGWRPQRTVQQTIRSAWDWADSTKQKSSKS